MNGGSMTKAELVEEVSRVSDLTKKHSEVIVDTVFKSIIDALHRGEKIELRGFGSFRLRKREPRKGRNPKTGDKVDVPPKKVPYFKPGKELKDLINREADDAADGGQQLAEAAVVGERREIGVCGHVDNDEVFVTSMVAWSFRQLPAMMPWKSRACAGRLRVCGWSRSRKAGRPRAG